jgi:hypothetical protein
MKNSNPKPQTQALLMPNERSTMRTIGYRLASPPGSNRIHVTARLARASYFSLCLWLGLLLTALPGSVWGDPQPVIKSSRLIGNTLTIQAENFPNGPLAVKFNGLDVPATYNQSAQQLAATLDSVPTAGTYLLSIAKAGTPLAFAFADVTIGAVGPQGPVGSAGPPGPQGTKGDTGATGATGTPGLQGSKGDTGNPGAIGLQGPAGAAGAVGP